MKKAFHLLPLVLCLLAAMPWYAAAQSHSVTVRVSDAGGPLAGPGYNSNSLYNFSPVYTVSKDFSKFEKYVWPAE